MTGSKGTGCPSNWKRRQRELREYLDAEVGRIAEAEGRSKAEIERLLLLAGVREYGRGTPLRFREALFARPDSMLSGAQRRELVQEIAHSSSRSGLRLVEEQEEEAS